MFRILGGSPSTGAWQASGTTIVPSDLGFGLWLYCWPVFYVQVRLICLYHRILMCRAGQSKPVLNGRFGIPSVDLESVSE